MSHLDHKGDGHQRCRAKQTYSKGEAQRSSLSCSSTHREHWEFQHTSENALNVEAGDDEMRNGRSLFFFLKPLLLSHLLCKNKRTIDW